jgi:hypothetical protein
VLDGILGNQTDLPVTEHATDTHGATLANFALFDLVDLQFSPRIRDLGKITLYRPESRLHRPVPGGRAPPYPPPQREPDHGQVGRPAAGRRLRQGRAHRRRIGRQLNWPSPRCGASGLRRQGAGLRFLKEAIDTTTPGGRLVFHVFAALAEFIRELIVEGTLEGLDAARARGQRLGRPPAMTAEQVKHAKALLAQPDASIASIARLLGVSRSTLYKYVPELKPDSQHPELTRSTAPQWGIAG